MTTTTITIVMEDSKDIRRIVKELKTLPGVVAVEVDLQVNLRQAEDRRNDTMGLMRAYSTTSEEYRRLHTVWVEQEKEYERLKGMAK